MAIEKRWTAVAPQAFTADGTTLGLVTIANCAGFKVKQTVVVQSISPAMHIALQVKRVISSTQLIVGPLAESLQPPIRQQGNQLLSVRQDISAFTVASGSFIFAEEQPKLPIDPKDIVQAVYRQEPGTTIGVEIDDQFGTPIDSVMRSDGKNALAVDAEFSGTITVGEVSQGAPNTPANAWPVEVYGTNGNPIEPNSDGSINVNIVSAPVTGQVEKVVYNEITSVASGIQTQIVSYMVPAFKTAVLHRIIVSGDNIARFDVFYNGSPIDTKRTWFGEFNENFDYTTGSDSSGFTANAGDIFSVKVLHNRPFLGSFEARIQLVEIG